MAALEKSLALGRKQVQVYMQFAFSYILVVFFSHPWTGGVLPVGLCTTKRDGEVKLRMDESGIGSEPPITIHELFLNAVNEYGNYSALACKKYGKWTRITFKKYYELSRMAAKSFLKVQSVWGWWPEHAFFL